MTALYDPKTNPFGHDRWMRDLSGVGQAIVFTDRIDFFDETPEADFLSNFYPSPIRLDLGYGQIQYSTGEHAYQAAKAKDEKAHLEIALSDDPGRSKFLGNTCDIREDWEQVKVEIMRKVLAAKFPFDRDNALSLRLVNTGTAVLIEGTNWNDQVWGVAYHNMSQSIRGRNLLGVLLMERRGVLNAIARGQF
jgi:ribA/ribD-fused uncharacterized protein